MIEKTILDEQGNTIEYSLNNSFDSCQIIENINDANYVYGSEIFSDEDLSQYKEEILKFAKI